MKAEVLALIRRLRDDGVKLSAVDGQLRVSAPKGALDDATVQALRDQKADILAWLSVLDAAREQALPQADTAAGPVPATASDPGLALVTEAWDLLPEAVRAGIVAMVKASAPAPLGRKGSKRRTDKTDGRGAR